MAVVWSLSSLITRTHVPFYVLLHGGHVCVNVWDVYLVCMCVCVCEAEDDFVDSGFSSLPGF